MSAAVETMPAIGITQAQIPDWFRNKTDRLFTVEVDGIWWTTNGHVLLRLSGVPDRHEPFGALTDPTPAIRDFLRSPVTPTGLSEPYVDGIEDIDDPQCWAVDAGATSFQLAYVELVRRLYPGCSWLAEAHNRPAQARIGDQTVAIVMCRRLPARGVLLANGGAS